MFSSVELAIMQPRTDPVELAITQYVVEWTSHIAKPVGFGEIKSIVFRFIMIVFLASVYWTVFFRVGERLFYLGVHAPSFSLRINYNQSRFESQSCIYSE